MVASERHVVCFMIFIMCFYHLTNRTDRQTDRVAQFLVRYYYIRDTVEFFIFKSIGLFVVMYE